MSKLNELLGTIPFINLWKWSDGQQYITEDSNTQLPLELVESEKYIEEQAEKYFNKNTDGKVKSKFKVDEEQLNKDKAVSMTKSNQRIKGKHMDREER